MSKIFLSGGTRQEWVPDLNTLDKTATTEDLLAVNPLWEAVKNLPSAKITQKAQFGSDKEEKAEDKPEAKADDKPEDKKEDNTEAKSEDKPETKADDKVEKPESPVTPEAPKIDGAPEVAVAVGESSEIAAVEVAKEKLQEAVQAVEEVAQAVGSEGKAEVTEEIAEGGTGLGEGLGEGAPVDMVSIELDGNDLPGSEIPGTDLGNDGHCPKCGGTCTCKSEEIIPGVEGDSDLGIDKETCMAGVSGRFEKVAKLSSKNREALRAYWTSVYGSELKDYVDAMTKDYEN